MVRNILYLCLVVSLAGCGDGGSSGSGSSGGGPDTASSATPSPDTPRGMILALEASGAIPELERDNGIAGKDENGNGIRDDIEAYIDDLYSLEPQHAAAIQIAKALQQSLLVDKDNELAVKDTIRAISRANTCIFEQFGDGRTFRPAQVSQKLEAITTNTKERILAYLAFSKALDGASWGVPEGDSCE